MKLLLDTQIVIWLINDPEKVSSKARTMLLNTEYTLYLSMASAWEVVIKTSKGKLRIPAGGIKSFLAKVEEMPISLLPIMQRHLETLEALPFIHKDPFDRLLIAAAKTEDMTILTTDKEIQKYDVLSAW